MELNNQVSILVLMDGWVKTLKQGLKQTSNRPVSILVLMDGWVKTIMCQSGEEKPYSFNPCFNGWMGKDFLWYFLFLSL